MIELAIPGYYDLHHEPILVKPFEHVSGQVMFVSVRLPRVIVAMLKGERDVGVVISTVRRYTWLYIQGDS
jgi:hypothetical protein